MIKDNEYIDLAHTISGMHFFKDGSKNQIKSMLHFAELYHQRELEKNKCDINDLSAGICDTCLVPKMMNSGDGINEPLEPILYCQKMKREICPEMPENRLVECKFHISNLKKSMNIDKYINWDEIWDKEVCVQTSIDCLSDDKKNIKIIGVIEQFREDNDVVLTTSECTQGQDNNLVFYFGDSGGQNESDNQGWFRYYTFAVDSDFMIIDAEYCQG